MSAVRSRQRLEPGAAPSETRSPRLSRRSLALAAAFAILVLLAPACRTANGLAPATPAHPSRLGIDYGNLTGEIRIDGSSTVFPISEAVAEEFARVAPAVRVNVAFSGTGGGLDKFCRGEIDIADASRAITEDELATCTAAGITDVVETQVAVDALAVMVSPRNAFVDCLTIPQLHSIFTEGGVTRWNQLDPSYPDREIAIYAPGTDSGTFDFFVDTVVEALDEEAYHVYDPSRVTFSEDDNVLALGIEGDADAIGYFGLAYRIEAGDALRAVRIAGGGGCVEPSESTARDGTYVPLSRPLFVYSRGDLFEQRPELLGFVSFYLDETATIVPEVGYAAMAEEDLDTQYERLRPYVRA